MISFFYFVQKLLKFVLLSGLFNKQSDKLYSGKILSFYLSFLFHTTGPPLTCSQVQRLDPFYYSLLFKQ